MRRFLNNAILHYDVLKKCISNMEDADKQGVIKVQLENIYECSIDIPNSYIESFTKDVSDKYLTTLLTKSLVKKRDIEGIKLIVSLCEDNMDMDIKNEALNLINCK